MPPFLLNSDPVLAILTTPWRAGTLAHRYCPLYHPSADPVDGPTRHRLFSHLQHAGRGELASPDLKQATMSSVKAQSMTCAPLAGIPGNTTTPGLNAIPAGFPVSKDGKSAWIGSKISEGDFVYHLTKPELVEIYNAVIAFKGRCHTPLILLYSILLSHACPSSLFPVVCRPH